MSIRCTFGFHRWLRYWTFERGQFYICPRCKTWTKSRGGWRRRSLESL